MAAQPWSPAEAANPNDPSRRRAGLQCRGKGRLWHLRKGQAATPGKDPPTYRPTHRCWSASEGGRFEPLSPASGDLGTERDRCHLLPQQPITPHSQRHPGHRMLTGRQSRDSARGTHRHLQLSPADNLQRGCVQGPGSRAGAGSPWGRGPQGRGRSADLGQRFPTWFRRRSCCVLAAELTARV